MADAFHLLGHLEPSTGEEFGLGVVFGVVEVGEDSGAVAGLVDVVHEFGVGFAAGDGAAAGGEGGGHGWCLSWVQKVTWGVG